MPRRVRRGRALRGVAAIVAVLAVVWGAVFLLTGHGGGDNTSGRAARGNGAGSVAPPAPSTQHLSPSAPPTSRASSRPSARRPAGPAPAVLRRRQATAVRALVESSAGARRSIAVALTSINRCQSIDTSIGRLTAAGTVRRQLGRRLGVLTVTALPGGRALIGALAQAFEQSAAADGNYAAWGREVRGSCRGRPPRTQNYTSARQHDERATGAKRGFVRRWNAIAAPAGQPRLDPDRI